MSSSRNNFPGHVVPLVHRHYLRIHNSLVIFWGSRDFNEFMEKTLFMTDDRLDRKGFDSAILKELMDIQSLHHELFPEFNLGCKWDLKHSKG